MSICCIEGCAGPRDEKEVYFEFPTSRLLRKRWLDAIHTAKVPPDSRVCCLHFAPDDYEMVRGKMRLRSKVIPTLHVGEVANNVTESSQDSIATADSKIDCNAAGNDSKSGKSMSNQCKKSNNDGISENDGRKSDNNAGESDNEKSDSATVKSGDDDKTSRKGVRKANKLKNGSDRTNKRIAKSKRRLKPSHNDVKSNKVVDKSVGDDEKLGDEDEKSDNSAVKSQNVPRKSVDENKKIDKITENSNKTDTNKENLTNHKNENVNGESENKKRKETEKEIDSNQKKRKTKFKITPKRKPPPDLSDDSTNSSDNREENSSQPDSSKEDIEGILTHYYIENKKTERQVAAMTDVLLAQCDAQGEEPPPSDPVFIELSVGQEAGQKPSNDCLMVLESVQCDVDPGLLLAAREEDEECEKYEIDDDDDDVQPAGGDSKQDPISLLTSSDEDDVIIEEPKIDTVEVSSADTDEDDVPLVKLVTPPSKRGKTKASLITKLLWGGSDFYCAKCRFTTLSASEYTKHMQSHSKVVHLCHDCGFATSSRVQLSRHKQKHKNEKRFKCPVCNYSAKHNMSLMYHMKTHKTSGQVEMGVCGVYTGKKRKPSKDSASVKVHVCADCDYATNRVSDLKRHRSRKHQDYEADDEEYVP